MLHDIENIIVAEGPIYLKDVADVYFGVKEEETYQPDKWIGCCFDGSCERFAGKPD